MNIFFTASLDNKKAAPDNVKRIYEILKREHTVYSPHLFERKKSKQTKKLTEQITLYEKLYAQIKNSDVVVAEISRLNPVLLFQLALSRLLKKQILLLTSEPAEVNLHETDFTSSRYQILEYDEKGLEYILKQALELTRTQLDQRFTLLLPPRIVNFLDTISEEENIPKSVYIRKLIDREIRSGLSPDVN